MKKIGDNKTLVFIVDVRVDKKTIKNTINKMYYNIHTKKVNTLIRYVIYLFRHYWPIPLILIKERSIFLSYRIIGFSLGIG
jgi:CRISPR/Cas system-associated protein Cas5 (RAMP superfamily)